MDLNDYPDGGQPGCRLPRLPRQPRRPMPRKPKHSPITCKYFAWKLFDRDGVFYADGRGGKYDLGKHSLGTRNKEEALTNLWLLDQKMAIEMGIAEAERSSGNGIPIAEGWRLYTE